MLSLLRRSKRVTENVQESKREQLRGLWAVIVVVAVPIRSCCVHDFENVISPNFGVCASHEVCRLCRWIHLIVLH
jgi:hypothetical protein